jgi:hypothetical protein
MECDTVYIGTKVSEGIAASIFTADSWYVTTELHDAPSMKTAMLQFIQ